MKLSDIKSIFTYEIFISLIFSDIVAINILAISEAYISYYSLGGYNAENIRNLSKMTCLASAPLTSLGMFKLLKMNREILEVNHAEGKNDISFQMV